jgi:cation diffusion facilitator family transporter
MTPAVPRPTHATVIIMPTEKERVAIVSVIASGSLAAAKFVIGVMIGSLALISDALHSLIDLGATLVTWYAVRIGDRPPDAEHHYGHGKVENVAAFVATALLLLLAGGVAVEAVKRLSEGGTPVTFSIIPFIVLGVEMAVNAWRARALWSAARRHSSQALAADALHFASDFFGSIPVIVGLALAAYGHDWGDSAAALAVAVLITILAIRMGRQAIDALVDPAPDGAAERVQAALEAMPGIVGVERVRMRKVGPRYFVDIAVKVPRTYPLDRVAKLKRLVDEKLDSLLGDTDVTITTTPVALDDETVMQRVNVIARNRALAVHHVTVQDLQGRLAVSLDLEVDGKLSLGAAHDVADELEKAIEDELGNHVEVETHIEPLQTADLEGRDAPCARVREVEAALSQAADEIGTIRQVHDVRVRETADGEIVNFHCRVDAVQTVHDVHEKVDDLERTLRERWPSIRRVIGHAEPLAH